jgi:cytochrome b561
LLAGGACGAALGYLGLHHTRFESTPEGSFYTPHSYVGLAVTVLFLARLAYDFQVLYQGALPVPMGRGAPALPPESPPLAVSGAFSAYYLAYYAGILRRIRQPATPGADLIQPGPQGGSK